MIGTLQKGNCGFGLLQVILAWKCGYCYAKGLFSLYADFNAVFSWHENEKFSSKKASQILITSKFSSAILSDGFECNT